MEEIVYANSAAIKSDLPSGDVIGPYCFCTKSFVHVAEKSCFVNIEIEGRAMEQLKHSTI
jgi:hypothetical protein